MQKEYTDISSDLQQQRVLQFPVDKTEEEAHIH